MLTARKATLSVATLLAAMTLLIVAATSASAASVAYLDAHEVWVATTDGSARARLSAGEGDWTAVAQSDNGYIVGVRLEAGKIAQLSNFTVWNPAGARIHFGPLAGNSNGSLAYPLSLDITPDGGLLVYGFSQYIAFPVSSLTQGHYLLPSATTSAPVPEPYKNTSARWPTLVGERIVGTPDTTSSAVQEAGTTGSTTFVNWFNYTAAGAVIHRTDVSATGSVSAVEVINEQLAPTPDTRRIALVKTVGLGGGIVDDCFLATDTTATQPSFSQDGSEFAWQDAGGVKVAGVPAFDGPATCNLTRAPITISPTGSFPSIGPFNVAGLIQTQTPPAPTPPKITAPSSAKLKDLLKGGISIKVSSVLGGKATLKLTVKPKLVGKKGKKPIVIGTASGMVAPGNVVKTIKLKLNRKGKSFKRKLKGKKATLTVTIAGKTTTKSIKLK